MKLTMNGDSLDKYGLSIRSRTSCETSSYWAAVKGLGGSGTILEPKESLQGTDYGQPSVKTDGWHWMLTGTVRGIDSANSQVNRSSELVDKPFTLEFACSTYGSLKPGAWEPDDSSDNPKATLGHG